ncbi:MAG: transglycosylase domain-containing protein [Bacteroidia bacterium]|nr:transglycosylase domain-containing protein [Bacteroidia bacterium]
MTAAKSAKGFKKYIIFFWLLFVMPLVALTLLLALTGYGYFGALPTFEQLENPESSLATEIISSDNVVLGKYYFQNRTNTPYHDLSTNITKALLATEDVRFYEHSGVDLKGLFRVLFKSVILQQDAGGGSTITQQLAKNLFPRKKQKSKFSIVIIKMKEWITATRLERNYTKDEIMAMYFNTVDFGHNAFGIKSAARTYFDKMPSQLNMQESALLVGMLRGPSYYNPVNHEQRAKLRRNTVLELMLKNGFISEQQCDSIKKTKIELKYQREDHNAGIATYFRETLRLELNKWCAAHKKSDGKSYNLYRDGLRIYTTIDSRMQRFAEEAVKEHLTDLQKQFNDHWKGRIPWAEHPEIITNAMKQSDRYRELKEGGATDAEIKKVFDTKIKMQLFTWQGERDTTMSPLDSIKHYKKMLQTGFMAMEPQTGYVRAWVGGNDYKYFKYDHVKEGKRQVGSTFKPFVYTLAMQEGYSPCYKVPNVKVTIETPSGPWTPDNSDNKYGGMLSLKEGLAESVNTVSAYLMKQFGPKAVVDIAHRMGIQSALEPVPAICLGTADLSVFELIGAYGTFANKGVWTEPVYITRIEDNNGVVLQEFIPKKIEAISEETAYLMINAMQGATLYGTSARLRGSKYGFTNAIAAKTGTTQNNSDGWFVGMVPNLVAGCWVGCEDRSVHFRSTSLGQGANMALPIWGLFMKKCYADKTLKVANTDFEKPLTKLSVEIDCSKYQEQKSMDGNDDFGINN